MIDPTRTTTLRKAYTADFLRRWNALRQRARVPILANQLVGFTPEQRGKAYGRWLAEQMAEILPPGGAWQSMYLRGAYMRGLANAHRELRRGGYVVPEADVLHQFSHRAALGAIYQKGEADLLKIQEVLANQVAQRIAIAEAAGADEEQLAAIVDGRIRAVGQSRSKTLVTTLVVGAVAEAVLNRLVDFGVEKVTAVVEYQFKTAGDSRVCPTCQQLAMVDNGLGPGVFTIEQSRGVLPVHGGCRCSWQIQAGRKQR